MYKLAKTGSIFIMFVTLMSCTQTQQHGNDPKRKLTEYIEKSFNVRSAEDKQALLGFLAGEARNRLASWSDDQFREAYIDSKRKFDKLVFNEVKQLSPKETAITYVLTYTDKRGSDVQITNKKLCKMTLENEKWLITEVRNIKELIEYKNEMSLP
jgi:hypothetical protein